MRIHALKCTFVFNSLSILQCNEACYYFSFMQRRDVKSFLLEELKNMCFLSGKCALVREEPLSESQFYSSVMVRLLQMETPSHW